MAMRIRFFVFLVMLGYAGIMPVANSHAAMSAESWRKQLQSEIERLSEQSAMLDMQGNVTVTQDGQQFIATLPAMTITTSDSAKFKVPAITLHAAISANETGNVVIRLPATIPYHNNSGQERGHVKIAEQNISGTWNYNGNYFENLSGSLNNVVYYDAVNHSQSTIGHILLDASNVQQPQLTAQKIQNITQSKGAAIRSSVGTATLRYQFAENTRMTLTRVIGLLNPVWLLADRQAFTINVGADNVVHTDHLAQVTTMQNIASRLQVLPHENGALLGGRMGVVIRNIAQQPESSYGFVLPQKLSLLGTLNNMPVQILNQPFNAIQDLMVQSGTRADISEIVWDTGSKARLKGTGWLKAAADVPLGMVGRFVLTIEDLRALNAALQKQLAIPGNDIKVKTQGYMLLMLLQTLVKEDNTNSEIVLDLTADGQVLVNNKNISSLLAQVGGFGASR